MGAVTPPPPRIDYLAKDFSSFRRLMLDRPRRHCARVAGAACIGHRHGAD